MMARRPRDSGSARFAPQLASPAETAPEGDGWLHEIKLDGYRIGGVIARGVVTLLSRAGNDWTTDFPEIRAALSRLGTPDAVLDGEISVALPDGRTSFHALQRALAGGPRGGLTYFVFDLLKADGEDITNLPIEERKSRLATLLKGAPAGLPLQYSDHVIGHGPAVFAQACDMGLEGVVSKRRGEPYRAGRSLSWLKIKGEARQEFVIGGFTERGGEARGRGGGDASAGRTRTANTPVVTNGGEVGALLCGTYDDNGHLIFAGKVGTGFSSAAAVELRRRLVDLASPTCPFTPAPDALSRRGARWVRPLLVAEVSFRNWTDDDRIRHSSYVGLRADKPARAVKREMPRLSGSKR